MSTYFGDAGTRAVGAQAAMSALWEKMGYTSNAGGQSSSSGDASCSQENNNIFYC
jgi:hypothetical protein